MRYPFDGTGKESVILESFLLPYSYVFFILNLITKFSKFCSLVPQILFLFISTLSQLYLVSISSSICYIFTIKADHPVCILDHFKYNLHSFPIFKVPSLLLAPILNHSQFLFWVPIWQSIIDCLRPAHTLFPLPEKRFISMSVDYPLPIQHNNLLQNVYFQPISPTLIHPSSLLEPNLSSAITFLEWLPTGLQYG